MYESFYQLSARPFLAAPLAERYYPAASIEQARVAVVRCVERGTGPAVVMGAAGTGKSMLCHVLAAQLGDRFAVATLASARLCTRRALLQNILYELKLPYRDREEGELRLALVDYLQSDSVADDGMLLLVDEAHTLPLRLLEEIRMITNLVRGGRPRVSVVLAADLVFDERLASPRLESLNQRIAARCYLQSMTRDETTEYVVAQLSAVGADVGTLLTPDSFAAVYRASDGVPRLVNQVCEHALVLASIGQRPAIDAQGIEEAWGDLQQLPVPWDGHETHEPSAGHDILEFGELDEEPAVDLDVASAADAEDTATGADAPSAPESTEPNAASDGDDERRQVVSMSPVVGPRLNPRDPDSDDVADMDHSFQPPTSAAPEIELIFHGARDPFAEPFEHEEVLVDPYASLEALNTPHATLQSRGQDAPSDMQAGQRTYPLQAVYSDQLDGTYELPELSPPAGEEKHAGASCPDQPADLAEQLPGDDRDLLEIQDDTQELAAAGRQAAETPPNVRPYRHLFADLRGRTA